MNTGGSTPFSKGSPSQAQRVFSLPRSLHSFPSYTEHRADGSKSSKPFMFSIEAMLVHTAQSPGVPVIALAVSSDRSASKHFRGAKSGGVLT